MCKEGVVMMLCDFVIEKAQCFIINISVDSLIKNLRCAF